MKKEIINLLEEQSESLTKLAQKIWDNPEIAWNEHKSAALQMEFLKAQGFCIIPVEGMPTAFIAEFGKGMPIVGFAGEYDALGSLSQKCSATKSPVKAGAPGHGCGHNLLGVGSLGAAIAIKAMLERGEISGTVRYYGCPAEEELGGKVTMLAKGVFDDLSCMLSWHPFDINGAMGMSSAASYSVKFSFKGISSHAGQSPEAGRSALDAVELMHVGVNYLREHVMDKMRMHYVITNGGERPNIVPDYASEWIFIRGPKGDDVRQAFERVKKIARGAALMTETKMTCKLVSGVYDYKANAPLLKVLADNFQQIELPKYSAQDLAFAKSIADTVPLSQRMAVIKSFGGNPEAVKESVMCQNVCTYNTQDIMSTGSFDLGDVSYRVPTAQIAAAAWPQGTPAHSWQSTAASGSALGYKAMITAAKVLALSAYDVLSNPSILKDANEAMEKYKAK